MRDCKWRIMLGLAVLAVLHILPGAPAVAQQEAGLAAVDYSDIDNWLCHPGNELDVCDHDLSATIVNADGSVEPELWRGGAETGVDCFYVYPTTSMDEDTYADLHPGRHEEIITTFTQFARFQSVCRVFAPVYRQITIPGLLSNAGNLANNDQRNYQDVVNAFNYYLENHNEGRGFVLVGHSQGTGLLTELIRNEIEFDPALRERLVSAVLAGFSVVVPKGEKVGGSFREVPLCESAADFGCVISFASYRDTMPPAAGAGLFLFGRAPDASSEVACFNPANPANHDREASLDAYMSNIGEIFQGVGPMPEWSATAPEITTPFVKLPGLLGARCVNDGEFHYLEISINADPSDPRTDEIRGDVLGEGGEVNAPWGLHLIDMTLTMGNLVDIVGRQAQAYLQAR